MNRIKYYSLIIVILVLLLPVLLHLFRKHPFFKKIFCIILLALYLLKCLYLTLIARIPAASYAGIRLTPFWSYNIALHNNIHLREEIILNILLFIPLGYLMKYVFPNMKWYLVLLTGFSLSLLIELSQLLLKLGLCEVDDLISNTLGTAIGLLLYMLSQKIYCSITKKDGVIRH